MLHCGMEGGVEDSPPSHAIEPTTSEQGEGDTHDFVLKTDKSTESVPEAESTTEAGLTPNNKDNYS